MSYTTLKLTYLATSTNITQSIIEDNPVRINLLVIPHPYNYCSIPYPIFIHTPISFLLRAALNISRGLLKMTEGDIRMWG